MSSIPLVLLILLAKPMRESSSEKVLVWFDGKGSAASWPRLELRARVRPRPQPRSSLGLAVYAQAQVQAWDQAWAQA